MRSPRSRPRSPSIRTQTELATPRRGPEVPRRRAEHRARATAARARRSVRRGDRRPTRRPSAARPTVPFLYRELAAVERQDGDDEARARRLSVRPWRSTRADAKSLGADRRDPRARGTISRRRAEAFNDVAGARVEPDAEQAAGGRARAHGAGPAAGGVSRDRRRAADHTRPIWRRSSAIRLAPLLQVDRRRDAALITDVRTHWAATWIMAVARAGGHGAVRQPRVSAANASCGAAISRRPSPGCCERDRRADIRPSAKSWDTARLKFTDLLAKPPRVSGRVGGGSRRRDDDRGRQRLPADHVR